jgi:arylformamidase
MNKAALSPEWHNHQYNNRARIPEHPQIFQRWIEMSEAARRMLIGQSRLDMPYTAAGEHDTSEQLDVFMPVRRAKAGSPMLVFIHGGYWRSLDKSDHSFIAPAFVNAGAVVVVPNYALCPAVSIEQITMQTVQALAWAWRHARELGGDPSRIVVVGHSAGGHLAAMLQCCQWKKFGKDLPSNLVRAALSISGLFELEPLRLTPFIQADLQLTEASALKLSPAYMPAPAGPLVAMVGEKESEEFLRQNRLIAERWGRKVVPVCEEVPGRNHLDVLYELALPTSRAHQLTLNLLGLKT